MGRLIDFVCKFFMVSKKSLFFLCGPCCTGQCVAFLGKTFNTHSASLHSRCSAVKVAGWEAKSQFDICWLASVVPFIWSLRKDGRNSYHVQQYESYLLTSELCKNTVNCFVCWGEGVGVGIRLTTASHSGQNFL